MFKLKKNHIEIAQLITTFLGIGVAVWIGLAQNNINAQLRDLTFLQNFRPVLSVNYDKEKSEISFTNFSKVPIFIDTTRIIRGDMPRKEKGCDLFGEDRTVAPNQTVSFDFRKSYVDIMNLFGAETFFVPFTYEIYFKIDGDSQIYQGRTVFMIDKTENGIKVHEYHPEVYLARTEYTDFKFLYEKILCPQS